MNIRTTIERMALGAALLLSTTLSAQEARLQVIHNCADLDAAVVDVYVNGALLLDDFAFRTATEFLSVPAEVDLEIAIARDNSTDVSDAVFIENFTLANGSTYVMVASGLLNTSGYEPVQEFSLLVFDSAQETAATTGVDLLVLHGSTDAPTVDVFESAVLNSGVINNLSYGEFTGYLNVPALDYQFEIQLSDGTPTGLGYLAPLGTLGLDGQALTVLASGFLNPALNSDGASFGLWAARAQGGALLELPPVQVATGTATVQVIHNSADAAAAVVDVYINDELAIPDLAFRTATGQVTLPSGVDLNIGVAPGNSTSSADVIATFTFNLDVDGKYIIVANGTVSGSGYDPVQPFNLDVRADARFSAALNTNTDVLVYHGATDAPTVDVAETSVPAGIVVDDISYTQFQGYLELATADYELEVRTTDGTPVARYDAPLESLGLDGRAITVLASGFLNTANNSDGPGFGLWVALSDGGNLIPLELSVGLNERTASFEATLYPNPTNGLLFIDLDASSTSVARVQLTDMSGRVVSQLSAFELSKGSTRASMDLSSFANGLYTLSVISDKGVRSVPVQVAH